METTPLEFAPIEQVENSTPLVETPPQQPTEEKPKRRGRPKKNSVSNDREKTAFAKPENPNDMFEAIRKEVAENEKVIQNSETGALPEGMPVSPLHETAKNVIDGYVLLTICDTFFPFLLKMFFKKAKHLKDTDIRMSREQKEHLQPIADEVAVSLLSWLDPFTLFFVLTGSMYYMNMEDALTRYPAPKEIEKDKK